MEHFQLGSNQPDLAKWWSEKFKVQLGTKIKIRSNLSLDWWARNSIEWMKKKLTIYCILLKVEKNSLRQHNNCNWSTLSGTTSATIFIQGKFHNLMLGISTSNFTYESLDINVCLRQKTKRGWRTHSFYLENFEKLFANKPCKHFYKT